MTAVPAGRPGNYVDREDEVREQTTDLDGIPLVWVEPPGNPPGTAVWLTHLGGSAQQRVPVLNRLAQAGFLAASFDPPGHGRRARRPSAEFAPYVLDAFRRRMWPPPDVAAARAHDTRVPARPRLGCAYGSVTTSSAPDSSTSSATSANGDQPTAWQ
jgi:pimeloyl-ACP methyl ester carboxylesterase